MERMKIFFLPGPPSAPPSSKAKSDSDAEPVTDRTLRTLNGERRGSSRRQRCRWRSNVGNGLRMTVLGAGHFPEFQQRSKPSERTSSRTVNKSDLSPVLNSFIHFNNNRTSRKICRIERLASRDADDENLREQEADVAEAPRSYHREENQGTSDSNFRATICIFGQQFAFSGNYSHFRATNCEI